ncbi:MAG: DUF1080 domain-containing protein [Rhodothermales bacterium]
MITLLLGSCAILSSPSQLLAQDADALMGRWNMTIESEDGKIPSWLEIRKSGNSTLVGAFVGQFGSARPIAEVKVDGNNFSFSIPPQWETRKDDLSFSGHLMGDHLMGETTDAEGKKIRWKATKSPALKRGPVERWGKPMALINGKDLSGWTTQFTDLPNGWVVKDGILINKEPGNNLITERKFEDFKLRAEFRYPEGSNGGIYLRGRYEMQIEDNYGDEPESHKIGGIYGYLTPSVNAAKKAGQWQVAEVTLVGRVITVVLNGERIIDRQTIPGMTGGALDNDEAKPGPIMLQGDHGPIEFRKLEIMQPQ